MANQRILIDDLRAELARAERAGEFERRTAMQDVRGSRVEVVTATEQGRDVDRLRALLDRMEAQERSTIEVPQGEHIRDALPEIEDNASRTLLVNGDGYTSRDNLAREVREDKDAAARLRANPETSPFAPAPARETDQPTARTPFDPAAVSQTAREDAIARRNAGLGSAQSAATATATERVDAAFGERQTVPNAATDERRPESEQANFEDGNDTFEPLSEIDWDPDRTGQEFRHLDALSDNDLAGYQRLRADTVRENDAARGQETAQDAPAASNGRIPAGTAQSASDGPQRAENTIASDSPSEPVRSDAVAQRYGLDVRENDDRSISYHRDGQDVMTDHGDGIDVYGDDAQSYAAAVSLAKERFPAGVEINFADEKKRDLMLAECARQGLDVANPELREQYDELRAAHERGEPARNGEPLEEHVSTDNAHEREAKISDERAPDAGARQEKRDVDRGDAQPNTQTMTQQERLATAIANAKASRSQLRPAARTAEAEQQSETQQEADDQLEP